MSNLSWTNVFHARTCRNANHAEFQNCSISRIFRMSSKNSYSLKSFKGPLSTEMTWGQLLQVDFQKLSRQKIVLFRMLFSFRSARFYHLCKHNKWILQTYSCTRTTDGTVLFKVMPVSAKGTRLWFNYLQLPGPYPIIYCFRSETFLTKPFINKSAIREKP